MRRLFPIPRPGIRFGSYPERDEQRSPLPFYWSERMRARLSAAGLPSSRDKARFLATIHARRHSMTGCAPAFIAAAARTLRSRLAIDGMHDELVAEAFALAATCMQMHFKLRLHDPQLLAAWMLLERRLVEMQTGEGKTLAVALATAAAALAGIPVHVVTANDYLVERDATALTPIFSMLGLSVGAITASTPMPERARQYGCDLTYCTAKELAFDYLRDQLCASGDDMPATDQAPARKLRGLCMAIIDEADSVLLDEARMPLILSQGGSKGDQPALFRQALFLAAQLLPAEDFVLDHVALTARLTEAGEQRAQALAGKMGQAWHSKRRRRETLCIALAARHVFLRDQHYLVQGSGNDKKIVIIDDTTGRQAAGRVWSRGLHQLIETKEGCSVTGATDTLIQTTFQRFFARYLQLSGISGTLREARGELLAVYGLPVATVALRSPSQRLSLPSRAFTSKQAQWQHIVASAGRYRAQGRPLLIGTDSVADSDLLSHLLTEAGVPHTALNARVDAAEAQVIARAGQLGAVTVSTNMAGRGTDIVLAPEAVALGGLHVIVCQSNPSRRIDRQLYGRCARQGQPGSVEHLYCIEDQMPWLRHFARRRIDGGQRAELPRWVTVLLKVDQLLRQRSGSREQWFLFLRDWHRERQLIFSGPIK